MLEPSADRLGDRLIRPEESGDPLELLLGRGEESGLGRTAGEPNSTFGGQQAD